VDFRDGSGQARILTCAGAFALIVLVGYVDSQAPHIAFSPFYLIPVCIASWLVSRRAGIAASVGAAAFGLAADLSSAQVAPPYAYINAGLRLLLLTTAAMTLVRLHGAIGRERNLAEQQRKAAARLEETAGLRAELIRVVADGAREPLGQIYARVVDLVFDMSSTTEAEVREVLNEIAQASKTLSQLVSTLSDDDADLVRAREGAFAAGEDRLGP